jgi:hypothetical protein
VIMACKTFAGGFPTRHPSSKRIDASSLPLRSGSKSILVNTWTDHTTRYPDRPSLHAAFPAVGISLRTNSPDERVN